MLEHDAAVGSRCGHRLAVDRDRALLDRQEAADQIEQGGLAAAGRPKQSQELARAHVERYLFERQHRPAARRSVDVADVVDRDLRRFGRAHADFAPKTRLTGSLC
jgi:hypothetical protein